MTTNSRTTVAALCTLAVLLTAPVEAQQAPDRSQRPAVGPTPELRLPALQEFTLPNGLRVLLMEKHDLPLVQVNLLVDAGSVRDVPGKLGLASLTADMLDEGADGRSALALADTFELLGARFGVGGGLHSASATLRAATSRLPATLPLMAAVVLRPDFPSAELQRLRKERLTGLLRQHDQPAAIASALTFGSLFGRAHPYGRIGEEASLEAITAADLKQFHQQYWRPNNATMVVVGDVQPASLRALLEQSFGGWSKGDVSPATIPASPQVAGRTIYLVDKPGAAQSVIQLGRIGVARATGDYFPLLVMNTILGGYFTSRLNQNLREQHGYTYGARSGFDFRPSPGPWTASASVATNVTGPALSEFFNELEGMLKPVPAEEAARARSYIASQFAPAFQSVSGIAGMIGELVQYHLPAGYFNGYTRSVLAVTPAEIERVAKQYIDPARTAVFVVGDLKSIEPQIRALNLGEIRVLAKEDVLGPIPTIE
jgi:predicted Zn-dependent peptidase